MTNKEEVFDLIQGHPEGLDDDDISEMTGIRPRQQIQQLCNQLAATKRIRRESIEKTGKRRKIHNFPAEVVAELSVGAAAIEAETDKWRRRLSALVAVTGRKEDDLLDEALQMLAVRVLKESSEM
jgi:hypothetical protein